MNQSKNLKEDLLEKAYLDYQSAPTKKAKAEVLDRLQEKGIIFITKDDLKEMVDCVSDIHLFLDLLKDSADIRKNGFLKWRRLYAKLHELGVLK